MGCSSSQSAEQRSVNGSGSCRVFKVAVLNSRGEESCSGQLEVTFQDLILHQKGKDQVQWPLWSLRRYGCDKDLFLFESGRRCPTGPGSFAFRCQQAEALFNLLHLSVVWTGQSQNNRLSTITESDPPSAVLNEICHEFRVAGENNLATADGTGPSYVNDPARSRYYNVLGHLRDDVCRAVNYADLELPPNENYDSAENENLANKHSYINVGSNGQRPQYVNVPMNGSNRRPYMNVPATIQKPFSVQRVADGKPRRPKSLEWQPFHTRPFEDPGYLNPRRDLSVGCGLDFPSSSLNQIRMNEAGDRKRNDIHPIQDDDRPGYATIDFDRPLPVGSRRRSFFDDRLRRTHHSCEIETMYYC